MANDIKIKWDSTTLKGDLVKIIGDLEREEGLETAVSMSIFTKRRVTEEELKENGFSDLSEKGGWWADQYSDAEDDQIGSKLWLLTRAKTTEQTLVKAQEYVYDGLLWMIEDNVASEINVIVERLGQIGNDVLCINVEIRRDSDTQQALTFKYVWDKQFNIAV